MWAGLGLRLVISFSDEEILDAAAMAWRAGQTSYASSKFLLHFCQQALIGMPTRLVSIVFLALRSFLLLMDAAGVVIGYIGMRHFRRRMRQNAGLRQSLVAALVMALRSSASYVLPVGTQSSTRASDQTFFLFFDDVAVRVTFAELGCFEEQKDESNEEDAEECELSPEVDNSEEWEVDDDAVEKGACDGWRAHQFGSFVLSRLAACNDLVFML